jgi:zinc protease
VIPERSAVDGVPVFWRTVPGPIRAMLIFRVGVIDETLPTRGITHLVEHLALFVPMQDSAMATRMNARVELHRTRFMAEGSADEVATFLGDVTSSLAALPLDRLEDEKRILRTEAVNKSHGSTKSIWNYRFGARGPGVADYEEFGLRWLGHQQVADWATANFTAGNAVLWLSGQPPAGLRLNLPPGPRRSSPAVTPLDFATPAIYQLGDRWVALSMLGPREMAMSVGSRILDARIRDRLRIQQSLAYEAHARYERLGVRVAEVTAFADSLGHNAREAAEAMVAVTRALADDGPKPEELARAVAERSRLSGEPESALGHLDVEATNELDSVEQKTVAELDAEAEALTPAIVSEAFQAAIATSYLAVPTNVDMNLAGFTPLAAGNGNRITGTEVSAPPEAGHADVIDFSQEGISVTTSNQTVIGMRWEDVAVGLRWNDGRRTLIGTDGEGINVSPANWRNPAPLLKQIEASVPAERWVPMDDPDGPPGKAAKPLEKPPWARAASLRRWLLAMLIIPDVLVGIYAIFGLVAVAGGETDAASVALSIFFATVFAISMAATVGVVTQARWARAVSIIAALGISFTVVGLVVGIPIWILASRMSRRAGLASTT